MRRQQKPADALKPLDSAVGALLKIVMAFVAVIVVGVTFFGFTATGINEPICITSGVEAGDNSVVFDSVDRRFLKIADGVEGLSNHRIRMCQADPTVAQRALVALTVAPSFAVFLGSLFATRRLIRRARREGLFDRRLAVRVERLGLLVVAGVILAAVAEWAADGLLDTTFYDTTWQGDSFDLSWAGLLGGCGVVTIGRVLARASDLQDDLEGTV